MLSAGMKMKVMKRSNTKRSPVARQFIRSLLPTVDSAQARGLIEYIPDEAQAVKLASRIKINQRGAWQSTGIPSSKELNQ
jgi:protein-tyrosine-phosphatase